jgi:uroporphyrinogen-III decarboxylase
MTSLGYDVLGVDWCISPEDARKVAGPDVVLQGNLDPAALYTSKVRHQYGKSVWWAVVVVSIIG